MPTSYKFSEAEKAELEAARKKNKNKNIERRLKALLLRAQGVKCAEVARQTGMAASYGQLLQNIFDKTAELAMYADKYVREAAINEGYYSHPVMYKVHGAMDMALWYAQQRRFIDIPIRQIKRLVCGDELASKGTVMQSLAKYVGHHTYECNDESDAVAVGIAYLKQAGQLDMGVVCQRHQTG